MWSMLFLDQTGGLAVALYLNKVQSRIQNELQISMKISSEKDSETL